MRTETRFDHVSHRPTENPAQRRSAAVRITPAVWRARQDARLGHRQVIVVDETGAAIKVAATATLEESDRKLRQERMQKPDNKV